MYMTSPLPSIAMCLRNLASAPLVRREALLPAACLAGDLLLPRVLISLSTTTPPLLLCLGLDNATHAFLALLIWWAVLAPPLPWPPPPPRPPPLPLPLYHRSLQTPRYQFGNERLELLVAFVLGSALDLDHFLAAGSLWNLHGALRLKDRPPGHCLTSLFALTALCWASIQYGNGSGNRRDRLHHSFCCCRCSSSCCGWWPRKEDSVRYSLLFLSATLSHQLRDAIRRGIWFCHIGVSTSPIPFGIYLIMIVMLPLIVRRALRVGEEEERGEEGGGRGVTTYMAVAEEEQDEAGFEMARWQQ